jgi:dihydroneopterin aldolase
MDKIIIADLEVFYQVGVTAEERARPQRLLLTLQMEHNFVAAATSDNLADTIDYHAVTQRLLGLGEGRQWELIETLASDIATLVLEDFSPRNVTVEVKKFIIPQTRYVSVQLTRARR